MNSKPNDTDFDLTKFRKDLREMIKALDPSFEHSLSPITQVHFYRHIRKELISFLNKDAFREEEISAIQLMEDVVVMLGTLAKNINSAFLPRVVEMVADFLDANGFSKSTPNKSATIVDEFITCWRLVMTETRLINDAKMSDLWPKAPRHNKFFDDDEVDTFGMDIDEANEKLREHALEKYRERTEQLRPSYEGQQHPIARLVAQLDEETEKLKSWKPFTDTELIHLNYTILELTLGTNTRLMYDCFLEPESEDAEPETGYESEITREDKLKNQAVDKLEVYLKVACGLAKEIDSRSYDDLAKCLALAHARGGKFYSYDDLNDKEAKRDLQDLMAWLQQACVTLWADCANYRPPKTRANVEEIKAHVTAETNREIAAKAPKRKKKFGHEGNGMKGPKTKMMEKQRAIFETFLKSHPVDDQHTRLARANQCWNLHKKTWDAARSATGENKGYSSPKALSAAK